MSRPVGREWPILLALLLVVTFLLYAGSFSHPWMHDDLLVVVENPDVRSFGDFAANRYPGRPLREVTYLLDYQLFGLEPAGWHVQNLLWHGLGGGLLCLLLRYLGASRLVAVGAALLFLVHPLQVEVVANVANRKDSLALCFSLATLLAWQRARTRPARAWPWFLLSVGMALLAVAAKEHAIILPLAVLGWELLMGPQADRLGWSASAWLAAGGTVVLLGIAGWLTLFGGYAWFAGKIPYKLATINLNAGDFGTYFRAVFSAWGELFRRVVWPTGLAPESVHEVPPGWLEPRVLLPVLAVIALAGAALALRRRAPLAALAIGWFLLFWLPVSNLLPLAYFAADRYLYAPLAGVATVAALCLERLTHPSVRWSALALVACLLAVMTWQQNRHWSSPEALWSHAAEVSPRSASALINLGDALVRAGEVSRATQSFLRAIEVNPAQPYPYYNLGVIHDRLDQKEQALFYFRQFLLRADASPVGDHRATAQKLRQYLARKYGQVPGR